MSEPLVSEFDLELRLHTEALEREGLANEALIAQLKQPRKFVTEYEAASHAAATDRSLSELGRENGIAAAREKALAGLEQWHTTLTAALDSSIAAGAAALDRAVTANLPQPSPLKLETLARAVASMDAVQLTSLYASASPDERRALEVLHEQVGRRPVRRADGSYTWEHLLSTDLLEKFRAARLEAADPNALRQLRRLERTRNVYRALRGRAVTLIRDGAVVR